MIRFPAALATLALSLSANAQTITSLPATRPLAAAPAQMVPERLDPVTLRSVLGRPVQDGGGASGGRIVDVLVDENGQVRAAVVDVGGFLGVGQRRVVVAWRALQFTAPGGPVRLVLAADAIKALPEFKPGAPVIAAAPSADPRRPMLQ